MLDAAHESCDEVTQRHFLDKAWHAFFADGVELNGLDIDILRSWRRARDTIGPRTGPRTGSSSADRTLLVHES